MQIGDNNILMWLIYWPTKSGIYRCSLSVNGTRTGFGVERKKVVLWPAPILSAFVTATWGISEERVLIVPSPPPLPLKAQHRTQMGSVWWQTKTIATVFRGVFPLGFFTSIKWQICFELGVLFFSACVLLSLSAPNYGYWVSIIRTFSP